MDKTTFDMIKNFHKIENDVYFRLCERGMDSSEVEDILYDSGDYYSQLLRLGKYTVEEECVNKETYILEPYEDIERYIKLYVIYEYDNGMALCETTSGSIYLVPQRLLACYNEEDVTEAVETEKEMKTDYVVSYLDLTIDKFKTLFFDSKEEAETAYKEIKANDDYMSEIIQSKKDYEKYELGID